MPQHTHASGRTCKNCDGFPVVTITTGTLNPDGTRRTINAACPDCSGTGRAARRSAPAPVHTVGG